MKRLMTLLLGFAALAGCTSPQSEQHVKNELRALPIRWLLLTLIRVHGLFKITCMMVQ